MPYFQWEWKFCGYPDLAVSNVFKTLYIYRDLFIGYSDSQKNFYVNSCISRYNHRIILLIQWYFWGLGPFIIGRWQSLRIHNDIGKGQSIWPLWVVWWVAKYVVYLNISLVFEVVK